MAKILMIMTCLLLQQSHGFSFMGSKVLRSASKNALQMLNKIDVSMPALSSTMKEGKIVSWAKSVGDKVDSGDVLLVVESDKADMDVESFEDGYLAAIYTAEGESAPVGAVVAVLVDSVDDIDKVGSDAPVSSPVAANPVAAETPSSPPAQSGSAPEFEQILMPALSSTMKEGKVVSWSKQVGDEISSGDMVLVVESDKADMDVESFEEGFLAAIVVGDGEVASVGSPVGYLAKTAADIPAVQAYVSGGGGGGAAATSSSPAAVSVSSTPVATPTPAAKPTIVNDGRVAASGYAKAQAKVQGIDLQTVTPSRADKFITSKDLASGAVSSTYTPAPGTINASPMARKLAKENKLDVTKIQGTGNFGRVLPDDVLRAAGKLPIATSPAPVTTATPVATGTTAPPKTGKTEVTVMDGLKSMDGMQKAVAKNMEKTLDVPIFRVSREIVTDDFDELYAKLKPKGVTVSAMLAKAVAEVLKKHPIINAAYSTEGGGAIKYNADVNVAMAVAIDGGLITPTIVKANEMDLFSIGRKWKELVGKAKEKKLSPAEYSSGTFTISNLGMFGVQQFDAILPPGTGSILAIAASTPKVVQLKNGHFGVKKSMTVTITCDHRHIYGADAAEFLKDLADLIENDVSSLTMG